VLATPEVEDEDDCEYRHDDHAAVWGLGG
jgi:hypothetical protein